MGTPEMWCRAKFGAALPSFQFRYFLCSQQQGLIPFPGGSLGVLCLGNPIGRFASQIQNSGPAGEFSIDVDLTLLPVSPPVAAKPGDTWNFQAWYRDVANTNNFTDAVSVTFQ